LVVTEHVGRERKKQGEENKKNISPPAACLREEEEETVPPQNDTVSFFFEICMKRCHFFQNAPFHLKETGAKVSNFKLVL
jgi:uncharacterized Fe-S radical SAM superfamily protein PflX